MQVIDTVFFHFSSFPRMNWIYLEFYLNFWLTINCLFEFLKKKKKWEDEGEKKIAQTINRTNLNDFAFHWWNENDCSEVFAPHFSNWKLASSPLIPVYHTEIENKIAMIYVLQSIIIIMINYYDLLDFFIPLVRCSSSFSFWFIFDCIIHGILC